MNFNRSTTRLFLTLIALGPGFITAQSQTQIGIGADHEGTDVDGAGARMNIEKFDDTFPTLPAGTYDVTEFEYSNSADTSEIQPFLVVNTGFDSEYLVIWIGPTEEAPGDDDIVTTPYPVGSQQFTLDDPAEVYAGFNAAGPNVTFGPGLTDHANPADFEIELESELLGFGHANLGRSYAFQINVQPNTSEVEDIGLDSVIAYPTAADSIVLSSAATGTVVGSLAGLGEFGTPVGGDVSFTLVAGAGDSNNASYSIGGDNGAQLLVNASLAGLDDILHSVRIAAEGDDGGTFEKALTFTVKLDSDADDLIDGWETMFGTLGEFATGGDHDADGLTDDDEFRRGFNPDNPDADDDGSLDGAEIANGTNPNKPDSDDDGLNDGAEAEAMSNPLVADTDGDSISDGDEVSTANGFSTDPTKADTDGDGFDDDVELASGSDPTSAASQPVITEVVIGIGSDHEGSDVDSAGARMNIEKFDETFPTLPAGTYDVTAFEYSNSTDTSEIQPFLVVNTGFDSEYSVIWIGPTEEAPGDDDIVSTPYDAGTQQFTLDDPAAVYAGFNAAGPSVKFGGGLTDHANPADFEIELESELSGFGHANLGRSYAFQINVEKSGGQIDFQITEIEHTGGESPSVALTFDSRPDAVYAIFASTTLMPDGQPGGWIELTDNFLSEGTETTYIDADAVNMGPNVYYQIRQVP
ncbi:MAG: hypothetical protein ACI9R3_004122 [Verrucomicrobiales bacterium]|jgi:hypothetical protein